MSWQRHMKLSRSKLSKEISRNTTSNSTAKSTNYSSYLPAVYTGLTNRTDRYRQYDQMDQDPEIRTALNIIADFCTQSQEDFGLPFKIKYKDEIGDTEVSTLEDRLEAWADMNQFKIRMYEIVRGILKYGDQFFIRDPETFEWYWVNPNNVEGIFVNQSTGKVPVIYYIRDVSLNLHDKVITNVNLGADKMTFPAGSTGTGSAYGNTSASGNTPVITNPFDISTRMDVLPVAAEHVIHLSLNTGQDGFWPFGTSILENIFKVYKQKELLEDSIIIYRVQRAPERRVFKIDTGEMSSQQAMAYVERFKDEIHQRRIPSSKGGSTSLMDAAYNPLCLDMNTRIPLLDGRTLSIWELKEEHERGKENWVYSCHPVTGEIVPGNITWAGVTKTSAKVIKITLDNGEVLVCTPDHKVPVLGYGFKEAKDLLSSDNLISFSKKYDSYTSHEQVFDHNLKSWINTHNSISGYFNEINKHQEFTYQNKYKGTKKSVVHHKDFDLNNNDPRNLQFMNEHDYLEYISTENIKYNICNVSNSAQGSSKIVSIEYLDEEITVGTITVDGQERWHNYHTFAIESGIFVKNSILEDYFFPQSSEGRGSSVETLPGGDNLGQIDDLRYFNNKLIRGLQIPASYLPMGPDDGGVALFGDGATQAMASELRFNNECMRYQRIVSDIFDKEFKRFMIKGGYSISTNSFNVIFNPPINFASYRKSELDAKLIQTYIPLNDLPYISKQFILEKMGLDKDDIIKNEKYWLQEHPEESGAIQDGAGATLQSVGIESPNTPESNLGVDSDGNIESADHEQMDMDADFSPDSLGSF